MTRPILEHMHQSWEALARRNPMHSIETSRRHWTPAEFRDSGRHVADRLLADLNPDTPRTRVLEIGCGLCRTLTHVASHFERADGIDIAPAMIEHARTLDLPPNLHLHVGSGADLAAIENESIDFVYSVWVMQHIPDLTIIAAYLREIRRVLTGPGLVTMQFDTRPATIASRLYERWPSVLLPRHRGRFARRYRRGSETIRQLATDAALTVERERNPDSMGHELVLGRSDRPATGDDA